MTERDVIAIRVRIDMMRQYTAEELELVLGDSNKGFLAMEEGSSTGKLHLQGIIWSCRKADTIRERIKSHLGPFNSSTNYSVSSSFNLLEAGPDKSIERYAQYCLKGFTAKGLGDHRVIWSKGFSVDELNNFNKAYWDLNNMIKLTNKTSKSDKRELLRLLKESVDDEVLFTPHAMARFIVDYCASNNIRIPHPTKVQEYVNTLLIYQVDKYIDRIDDSPYFDKERLIAMGYRVSLISEIAELCTPRFSKEQLNLIQANISLVKQNKE